MRRNCPARRRSPLRWQISAIIESYDRRIQSAINIQRKKLQRRAEFFLTRALRQAGCQKAPRLTCFKSLLKTTRRAW